MFVDEVLITKTEETIQFYRRKVHLYIYIFFIITYSCTALSPNTLSVDVTGSSVHGLVGTSYTLTCTVTLSTRIMGSPVYIQCEGPGLSSYHNILTDQMT